MPKPAKPTPASRELINDDFLHELAQSIIMNGEPKKMSFHRWHMTAMPKLEESRAIDELGIWKLDYGLFIELKAERVNDQDVVMLYFS